MKHSKSEDDLSNQLRNIGGKRSREDVGRLKARLRDTYSDEISYDDQNDLKHSKPKKGMYIILGRKLKISGFL